MQVVDGSVADKVAGSGVRRHRLRQNSARTVRRHSGQETLSSGELARKLHSRHLPGNGRQISPRVRDSLLGIRDARRTNTATDLAAKSAAASGLTPDLDLRYHSDVAGSTSAPESKRTSDGPDPPQGWMGLLVNPTFELSVSFLQAVAGRSQVA